MDAVLAAGEFDALLRHAGGSHVDPEVMKLFDEIATAKGKEAREFAIGRLQAMAEAGLLVPANAAAS
jgi:hypothetical protein